MFFNMKWLLGQRLDFKTNFLRLEFNQFLVVANIMSDSK